MQSAAPQDLMRGVDAPPFEKLAQSAQAVAVLCDLLETICDGLPGLSVGACRQAARLCETQVTRHLRELNQVLIPLVRDRITDTPEFGGFLNRLQSNLVEDDVKLDEVVDILNSFSTRDGERPSMDALGYVLRGFFETLRRQLNWENEVLLPLARRVLRKGDLRTLGAKLAVLQGCQSCPSNGSCACKQGTIH